MDSTGPYDLKRCVEAQNSVIDEVKRELQSWRKQTHWMWSVFPQAAGLGRSDMARRYATDSMTEVELPSIIQFSGLGCASARNSSPIDGRTTNEISGSPGDLNFCSLMTLFELAADDSSPFRVMLETHYDGERDLKTLETLDY